MRISITSDPIEPWTLLHEFEQQSHLQQGKFGATAVFIGTMRDINEQQQVSSMTLEHYPGMTEKFLQTLADEALQKWQLQDVLIVHRVGQVAPADTIVVVAVWSAHRAHAYEANRHIMEALKSRAPFWKKEQLANGELRWVEKNTPGTV